MRRAVLALAVCVPNGALGIAVAAGADVFRENGTLQQWQTLIAGVMAIVAAFIGGHFITRQIRAAEQLEAEQRRRRFNAVRAVSPFTLSAVSGYARLSARALKSIHEGRAGEAIPHNLVLPDFPDMPSSMVQGLREIIEHGGDDIRKPVAKLLGELQVQNARITDMWADIPNENHATTASNVEDYLIDCAIIYARASSMYDFARERAVTIPDSLSEADIKSALHQVGIWDYANVRIFETVGRRYSARGDGLADLRS